MPPLRDTENDKYSASRGGGLTMQHDLAIPCSYSSYKKTPLYVNYIGTLHIRILGN